MHHRLVDQMTGMSEKVLSRIGGVGCANPSNLLKGLLSGVTCMNANAEKRGERYEEEYGEHGI